MENKIKIKYMPADLDRFHARLIADGHTGLFLPASILIDRAVITAVYDIKGFVPLKDIDMSPERLMRITADLLEKMAFAEHRYFQAGEYHIKKCLIFIERSSDQAGIIYEKSKSAGWESAKREISGILSQYASASLNAGNSKDHEILERMKSILECSRSMEGCARIFRNISRKNEHARIKADIEAINAAAGYR